MNEKSFIRFLFVSLKKTCNIFGYKFKFFREINKILLEIEKTIRLYNYTREFLQKRKFNFVIANGIKYPSIQTIKDLHDFLVVKYEKDIDKIHNGEISLSQLEFEGIKYWLNPLSNPEEDLILRGAHIFNKFLEEGHPFVDGNKRTGWATLWAFLVANGLYFTFPDSFHGSEQAKRVEKWAELNEDSDNIKEIVVWIKKYIGKK